MSDAELVKRLRGRTTKKLSIDWQVGRDCPECGSMADRRKCLLDYGPSCPRHDPDAYDPPAWDHVADKDCAEAADRIEALAEGWAEATQLLQTLSNMNGDLSRDMYKTKLLLAKAVEALAFYANEENYKGVSLTDSCGCCSSWYDPKIHIYGEDSGHIARATLAEIEGEKT